MWYRGLSVTMARAECVWRHGGERESNIYSSSMLGMTVILSRAVQFLQGDRVPASRPDCLSADRANGSF